MIDLSTLGIWTTVTVAWIIAGLLGLSQKHRAMTAGNIWSIGILPLMIGTGFAFVMTPSETVRQMSITILVIQSLVASTLLLIAVRLSWLGRN